eukprot:TRINITY_DN94185_c0_g1_i1.p1 TRINITY_DN94185_c0_g1~~TRINITY_DN94185_c0_g1_i1.p1  ORF type:complete len:749 (-),score=266.45 TRINITY_DN94185_c0_g1_i1:94-2340(-)
MKKATVSVICALSVSSASSLDTRSSATPVENVIELLTNLKSDVSKEKEEEASTFEEFSKFCKDTQTDKTEAIKVGQLKSEEAAGTIKSKQTDLAQATTDLAANKEKAQKLAAETTESGRQCVKDEAAYDATNADLTAAIAGLERAVEKLNASKDVAFMQLQKGNKALKKSLDIAEAMGLLETKKRHSLNVFLQGSRKKGEPSPWLSDAGAEKNKEDYKFQSDGVVTLLGDLLKQFQDSKATADEQFAQTKKNCGETATAKADAISANEEALQKLQEQASALNIDISDEQGSLISIKQTLKDDQQYLSQLKENCAARAADFNQRSAQRESEIKAISAALKVMKDKVHSLDGEVNQAPSFMQLSSKPTSLLSLGLAKLREKFSFSSRAVVEKGKNSKSVSEAETQMMVKAASNHLAKAGSHIGSDLLSGLALQMNLAISAKHEQTPADGSKSPLQKVKDMVQKLVNDILSEAEAEATKKGACDTQINKAKMERARRLNEAKRINAKVMSLEAKRVRLEDENSVMADELAKLREDLAEGTKLRTEESEENRKTMEKAKEGSTAVKAAVAELQAYYRKAALGADAHNKVALLQKKQTQPAPAVAEGAYAGKQEAATDIISLMENLGTTFDKTLKDTKALEEKASDEYIKFKSESNSEIANKETGTTLNNEDLKEAQNQLEAGKNDLNNTMQLLDAALQTLADLKPQCVDAGMSYAERKAKRDQEIEDLNTALCLLDPTNAGPECNEVLGMNH